MAGRRLIGARIPLVQRIMRYGSMATLFRRYDDSAEPRLVSSELITPRSVSNQNDASPADASVVQATLLPGESSLPVGLMVSPVGISPTVQRVQQATPPVQREVTAPQPRPVQAPETPSISQAPHGEPAKPEIPRAPPQQPVSGSTITDADWKRLKAVMQGHQEKLAREKDSPENIQRAKKEAEQEAAKKQAEAETKRRQELVRSGKLPRAQVVYLSPDEPSPLPTMPLDSPEIRSVDQERDEEVVQEATIDAIPDVGIEAVEEPQREEVAGKPDTIEAAEPHRAEPPVASETVQLAPDQQEQEKRIPEPGAESIESAKDRTTTEQPPKPVEAEPTVEPVAKTLQLETEPAESAPLQEAETPSTPETAVESEEKEGIGQRLLDAARSVFRRAEKPPSLTEPSVPQAEPPAPQAEPSLPQAEPSAPQAEPSILLAEEEEVSSEIPEEKPVDILTTDELETGQDSQDSEYHPKQIEEGFQVQDVPDSQTIYTPVVQPTPPVVQRTPEKTAPKTPESPVDEIPSRQPPDEVEEKTRSGDETLREPIVKVADESIVETSADIQKDTLTKSDFEAEPHLTDTEAPALVEQREKPTAASIGPAEVHLDPEPTASEPDGIQQEPEATGPKPAAIEPADEDRVEVRDKPMPPTEKTTERLELPSEPGEEERVDKTQPPLPVDSEERLADLQQLPLEEVWPVQQAELATGEPASEPAIQDSFPEQRDESGEMPTLIVQRETAEDISSETELRRTLDKVSPGKPTDSSIELVPPRRPRPSVVPEQSQLEDPGSSEPPVQPVQRLADGPERIETGPAMDRPDGGSEAVNKITQPEPRPQIPETVTTEIGELPSDFWHYLGEEPPTPTVPQPRVDGPQVATQVATLQRSDVVATAPPQVLEYSQPTKTLGLEEVLPWIQRTDSGEQAESGGDESESEVVDADEGGAAEDVDIEKLARDILPIIKRKLSIEWERNRGRF
ncbi:MAG: hypothetical protein WA996_11165 [Candidatus Promineifilaceae bacterium]